jgi:hypothetical protein
MCDEGDDEGDPPEPFSLPPEGRGEAASNRLLAHSLRLVAVRKQVLALWRSFGAVGPLAMGEPERPGEPGAVGGGGALSRGR